MQTKLSLYHGSGAIIEKPICGEGNPCNDYGLAFYCTESLDMAREWAVTEQRDGFVNHYELDMEGLSELNLGCGAYHILNWLAILLENRVFRTDSDLKRRGKEYIIHHFGIEYRSYDLIRGYRADDSYFSFANAFLNNSISLEQLERAMYLGQLGEQVAIRSEKAFERLEYLDVTVAGRLAYYPLKKARDDDARKAFQRERSNPLQGVYLIDIMRETWENDDERLQRVVSGRCDV